MTVKIEKVPLFGQRHLQMLLVFLSIVVNFYAKLSAGVAVVAMTNAETANPDVPEYDWTEMQKSYILSSFFWGSIVTEISSGYLCRCFGAKIIMFISILGSAVFGLLIPITVGWGGWQVYCGIRVVQGLFQGLLLPCTHTYMATWFPVNERNRLCALANTGVECGNLLAMFLSGIIAASAWGWPGISYVSFTLGIGWCILWLIFAADSPNKSKLISEEERNYIENSKNALKKHDTNATPQYIPVPWHAILTSRPFWALVVVKSALSWGFFTMQGKISAYMKGFLGMEMKNNALYSGLPYLAMWFMSYVYLISADIFLQNKIMSLNTLRKTFNSLASWVPAIGLIGLGFVTKDQETLAIILMTINVGVNAGSSIGSALNTIDLSPNHAGILLSVSNTFANIVPIVTPLVLGGILNDETDRTQWQIVFAISAVAYFIGNLFYVIYGSTDLQPWDDENFLLLKKTENDNGKNIPP